MISNVHFGLKPPNKNCKVTSVNGTYRFYHYCVDNTNDIGWGCGYRTLQTIISWLTLNKTWNRFIEVPSISEIQQKLYEIGDKDEKFIQSKDWIGTYEAFLVIDSLFNIPCQILHVSKGKNLHKHFDKLVEHFTHTSCPIMMGGDLDSASKTIVSACCCYGNDKSYAGKWLLIVDPHFINDEGKPYSVEYLQTNGFVSWRNLDSFETNSFYNFCIPIIK